MLCRLLSAGPSDVQVVSTLSPTGTTPLRLPHGSNIVMSALFDRRTAGTHLQFFAHAIHNYMHGSRFNACNKWMPISRLKARVHWELCNNTNAAGTCKHNAQKCCVFAGHSPAYVTD